MERLFKHMIDNFFAAMLDVLTYAVIFFAKSVMSLVILAILIYMFAGWIKAMLGAAFAPIALVMAPLDRGRLFGSSVGFVMGGIASYAFTLATGLLMLKMFTVGADKMLQALAQHGVSTLTGTATYAMGFAIMALLLSIMMLLVVFNAKNWGAEFFGSAAFDMSSRVLNQALGKAVAAGSIKGGKIAGRATAKAAGAAATGAGAAGAALAGAAGGVIGGMAGGAKGKGGFLAMAAGAMRGAVRGMSPGAQAAFQQSPSGQRASQAMQAAASRVRAATSKARQTAAAPARYASTGYQAGKSATPPKTPPS